MARACAWLTTVVVVVVVVACALTARCCEGAATAGRDGGAWTLVLSPLNATLAGGVHHAYWFRRLFATPLTERDLQCMHNGTVAAPANASRAACHWLFSQGPCAARQWLVLAEQQGGGLAPACRPRPCAPGYELLEDERRCAPADQLCAGDAKRVFRYSLRGQGRCHCKGFYAHAPDGQCRQLYARGSCPDGQMLAPVFGSSLESRVGACVRNPCAEGQLRVEDADGRASACVALEDLDCSLATKPLLAADGGLYVPLCVDAKRHVIAVHSRPSRDACPIKDNQGQCVRTLVRSPQPFDWGLEDEDADSVAFPADRR